MLIGLYLLPLIGIIAALALSRATLLQAGCIGLLLSVPGIWLILPDDQSLAQFIWNQSLQGAWLAWQAISIILAGLLFYYIIRAAQPDLFNARPSAHWNLSYRSLFAICFFLGPFAEAATGFGVGVILALAALTRLGLTGVDAVVFSLFSQTLVPWGALAIGTVVGAELADVPVTLLGTYSALLSAVLLLGYLLIFWRLSQRLGLSTNGWQKLDDVLWIMLLALALYLTNRYIAVEIAGLSATGMLLIIRFVRDTRPDRTDLSRMFDYAAPYALLTLVLIITRSNDNLAASLQALVQIKPTDHLPAFPVFYHASFWLLLVALAYGLWMGVQAQRSAIIRHTVNAARAPVLVTLVFVILAQWLSSSGIVTHLASAWVDSVGSLAIIGSPWYGATAGFLTGSNVASNAIMMPLQTTLSQYTEMSSAWIAAVQNTAGSHLTLLSPIRVAMACALIGLVAQEKNIYRQVWPLGAITIVVLTAACVVGHDWA